MYISNIFPLIHSSLTNLSSLWRSTTTCLASTVRINLKFDSLILPPRLKIRNKPLGQPTTVSCSFPTQATTTRASAPLHLPELLNSQKNSVLAVKKDSVFRLVTYYVTATDIPLLVSSHCLLPLLQGLFTNFPNQRTSQDRLGKWPLQAAVIFWVPKSCAGLYLPHFWPPAPLVLPTTITSSTNTMPSALVPPIRSLATLVCESRLFSNITLWCVCRIYRQQEVKWNLVCCLCAMLGYWCVLHL